MPPLGADDRLRRLLALVPWVAAQDGPRVEEVCTRFGLTERELAGDLDLLFLCGLYPYTPDMLIEADISDGRVWIRYAEYFSRPLRLTPAEGLALVAAGRTALAWPGADPDGPLARGLAKLAAVLKVDPASDVDIDPGDADPSILGLLRDAVDGHRAVDLDYYSFGRDTQTRRVVEPHSLFSAEGQWYLSGHCRAVADERLFRVDRVRAATVLDEVFTPPARPSEPATYTPRDDDERVVVDLAAAAHWVVEHYPVEDVSALDDGRIRARLAVSERAWLERLLLRLGPDAQVVSGPADGAAEAAARVLVRYRGDARVR